MTTHSPDQIIADYDTAAAAVAQHPAGTAEWRDAVHRWERVLLDCYKTATEMQAADGRRWSEVSEVAEALTLILEDWRARLRDVSRHEASGDDEPDERELIGARVAATGSVIYDAEELVDDVVDRMPGYWSVANLFGDPQHCLDGTYYVMADPDQPTRVTPDSVCWGIYWNVAGDDMDSTNGDGVEELRRELMTLGDEPVDEVMRTEIIMGRCIAEFDGHDIVPDYEIVLYRVVWTPKNISDLNGQVHTVWADESQIPLSWGDQAGDRDVLYPIERGWVSPARHADSIDLVDDESELTWGSCLIEKISDPWNYGVGDVTWYMGHAPRRMPTNPDVGDDHDY